MTVQEAPADIFAIPNEWIYRGEGNCNIVISLPKSRQILRIRKTEKPKTILGWILVLISDLFHWYHGKGFKEEIRDLNFYSKVTRPLIGNKYTSESKQVILSRKQIQIFKDGLIKKRPEFRQNKTLQYGRAALFDDFAFLPKEYDHHLQFSDNTFSVEIKPKQGWRPPKEQMYPQCFFCMNQYLKLENKIIKSKTKYCPEELFSGDRHRMKATLKYLIEIPQNNLKIFKNGLPCVIEQHKIMEILQEVFESNGSKEILTEEFCDFLQKCLVKDLKNSGQSLSNKICKNNECYLKLDNDLIKLENKLPQGSVLGRILSVQKMDQEGTHSTYKKLMKNDTWEDYNFVDELLENLNEKCDICIRCAIMEAAKNYNNELIFLPYLISAIAKDCSLMITFRKLKQTPCDEYKDNIIETQFGAFVVNIGVFDLYPKPLSTIRKHYKRNKDIFRALKKIELVT